MPGLPVEAGAFQPKLHILPAAQALLWPELSAVPGHFALYGGTGLALHLGHRQSADFDLFSEQGIDPDGLLRTIPFLRQARVANIASNTLDVVVDRGAPVRVSFFGLPRLQRLLPPYASPGNGLNVASLLDLAGTKAAVVQQRSEMKDYLDVAAILADGRISLPLALSAARAIYGGQFNPQITLKALAYFGDGDLHALPAAPRQRLVEAVASTDPARLPLLETSRP